MLMYYLLRIIALSALFHTLYPVTLYHVQLNLRKTGNCATVSRGADISQVLLGYQS
jgi:hypothetical protein